MKTLKDKAIVITGGGGSIAGAVEGRRLLEVPIYPPR